MTTRATALTVLIVLVVSDPARPIDSLMTESLGKLLGTFVAAKQVRIPELLNQLCNSSQGSNALHRDACYGCFYRASVLPQGYPMLLAMSRCANDYLNNTSYGHCQAYLQNATSTFDGQTNPTIIYCTFLECIRQVNKGRLDVDIRSGPGRGLAPRVERPGNFLKLLKVRTLRAVCVLREVNLMECVSEAARTFPRFNGTEAQLAQLFVNTTACVLAKTRCSYTNPVTGAHQDVDIANKLPRLRTVNAVLVNTDYDINIVQLPFGHQGGVDVCTKYRNVQQATWPGVAC